MDKSRLINRLSVKDINWKGVGRTLPILIFGFITACGAQPNVKYETSTCGDTRILDLKPGDRVDLTDAGSGKYDFSIDENGDVVVPGVSDKITDPNAVDYIIGDKTKQHYVVKSLGKDGDVQIEKNCPAPPITPTPNPTPSETPIGIKGTGRYASIPRGFSPGAASKPVQVFRRF
ncbi:MAG: hypothetical protein ACOYUB_00785 [Patescibacteria group bacterium]